MVQYISARTYNNHPINKASIKIDTLPDDGFIYDTLVIFDRETYKSRTIIYRTKIEGYRYDTMIVYDPETYDESIQITRVAYGSEREIVRPESDVDKLRKQLECYQLIWGPLKHNYVFGSPNRILVNPKMIDELLESDIMVESDDGCDSVSSILSLNIYVQYDNGSSDTVANGCSAKSRKKLLKKKRRTKDGTIYLLDEIVIEIGDTTLNLPYVQFVIKK